MNKKLLIVISMVILLVTSFIIFYPKYIEKKEINSLKQEVELANKYLELKQDKDSLEKMIQEDLATGERKEIEEKLDIFLSELLKEQEQLDIVVSDNAKLFQEFQKEKINEIGSLIEKDEKSLSEIKNNIISLKDEYYNNNEMTQEINIDLVLNKVNELDTNIQENQKINTYLKNNSKTFNVEDEKIVFIKRKNYQEYEKLAINNLNYELVKDTTGPVITAKDITINLKDKLNVKDKVKCVDAVDDTVECKIDGKFDNTKVGTYKIKITASDKAGNKSEKTIKVNVKEKKVNKNSYYIEVIRNHNVVVVYGLDENNEYKKIVKVFVCSVGKNNKTPTGTFKTSDKAKWGWLVGNVYGQYYTRITGSILFHSVPYYKKDKSTLEWEEYNKLGTAASKGCVRLAVKDVKWIYDNCKKGTTVKIYDGDLPKGVSKPSATKISGDSPNKGWDPTDPDKNNPWKK